MQQTGAWGPPSGTLKQVPQGRGRGVPGAWQHARLSELLWIALTCKIPVNDDGLCASHGREEV